MGRLFINQFPVILSCYFPDPPVVTSPPHFYQSDKSLLQTVHGLKPEKSEHETFLEIEPVSKVIIQALSRYVLIWRDNTMSAIPNPIPLHPHGASALKKFVS